MPKKTKATRRLFGTFKPIKKLDKSVKFRSIAEMPMETRVSYSISGTEFEAGDLMVLTSRDENGASKKTVYKITEIDITRLRIAERTGQEIHPWWSLTQEEKLEEIRKIRLWPGFSDYELPEGFDEKIRLLSPRELHQ